MPSQGIFIELSLLLDAQKTRLCLCVCAILDLPLESLQDLVHAHCMLSELLVLDFIFINLCDLDVPLKEFHFIEQLVVFFNHTSLLFLAFYMELIIDICLCLEFLDDSNQLLRRLQFQSVQINNSIRLRDLLDELFHLCFLCFHDIIISFEFYILKPQLVNHIQLGKVFVTYTSFPL